MYSNKSKSVIIRFHEFSIQQNSAPINRINGVMYGSSMVDLIDEFINEKYSSDDMELLEANPRNPKKNNITELIIETLNEKKELFPLMSKGVLLSVSTCKLLERNRFEITFNNPKVHGILDGGHNALAIAIYILQRAGALESEIKKIKLWTDVKSLWNSYSSAIEDIKKLVDFLISVEVLYPKSDSYDEYEFISTIMDVAQARNNNTQLTPETKSNKKGYYEVLKDQLDPNLASSIEWSTNAGGSVKVRELVALSLIPLSKVELGKDINPVQIYSSKARCVSEFDNLINTKGVSQKADGDYLIKIVDEVVISALGMINILPHLYDLIYELMPEAYNKSSNGKFGLISSVSKAIDGKPVFKTKFYSKTVDYNYPDGFIMPLVYGLRELMAEKANGQLYWLTDPVSFIQNHISELMTNYGEAVIKMSNFDPQKVGKNRGSYAVASMAYRDVLVKNKLI